MKTLEKIYLLSWLTNGVTKPVGVFANIEEINEAIKVRFNFINESLPKINIDYKIDEFQFGLLDD